MEEIIAFLKSVLFTLLMNEKILLVRIPLLLLISLALFQVSSVVLWLIIYNTLYEKHTPALPFTAIPSWGNS